MAVTRHFCSAKVLVRGLRRWEEDLAAPQHLPAKRNFQRKFALRRNKTEGLLLGSKIVVYESKSDAVIRQKESAHVTVSTL